MNHYSRLGRKHKAEASSLVLQATRSWVGAVLADACNTTRRWHLQTWEKSFQAIGHPEAIHVWCAFMRLLSIHGTRKFLLGCAGCGRVSDDEKTLLQCLQAYQSGCVTDGRNMLAQWFANDHLSRAETLAETFADMLGVQGYEVISGGNELPVFELVGSGLSSKTSVN